MTLTAYYETLLRRIQSLPDSPGFFKPTEADLQELQNKEEALGEGYSSVKPIKRPKYSDQFSLYKIGGVRSIKISRLGEGKAARTYLQIDGLPGRDAEHCVAVKVFSFHARPERQSLPDEIEIEKTVLERLGRFIRLDQRVNDAGITKVYLVQQYIPGETLHAALKAIPQRNGLSMQQALNLMTMLCKRLQEFHAIDYMHGDLHDHNVMVTGDIFGEPKLTLVDFNWSTPPYKIIVLKDPIKADKHPQIAPECCGAKGIIFTPSTEVYALGAIFKKILDKTLYNRYAMENCERLIARMRAKDPVHRPLLKEIQGLLSCLSQGFELATKRNRTPDIGDEQLISAVSKKAVLQTLSLYLSGLRAWRSYAFDDGYLAKSQHFRKVINELTPITSQRSFHALLKKGVVDYLFDYVIPDLSHYSKLEDPGAGMNAFIDAIRICGDDFDVPGLVAELHHVLAPHDFKGEEYFYKVQKAFESQLGVYKYVY